MGDLFLVPCNFIETFYKLKRQVTSHCKSAKQRLSTYRSSCFEEGGTPHLVPIAIIEVIIVPGISMVPITLTINEG